MPIFKLKLDELVQQWYRSYYEVEANTLEEAVEMVKIGEGNCYDFKDFDQEIVETEIIDETGNVLYKCE